MRLQRGSRVCGPTSDSRLRPRRLKTWKIRPRTRGWWLTERVRVWMLTMSAWADGFLSVVWAIFSLMGYGAGVVKKELETEIVLSGGAVGGDFGEALFGDPYIGGIAF